jgi:dienelactone hydrolase
LAQIAKDIARKRAADGSPRMRQICASACALMLEFRPVTDRKDDPAFLYFPTNYRWSMGLLICLSGAPWGGAEIGEVNRVGRALRDKVGDDDAWFAEWVRMGDKIEARGRAALADGHKLTAAACFMRATRYYQTGERFIHPRSQHSMDVYAKAVRIFKEAAGLIHRPRIESVEVPYGSASLPALLVHPDPEATAGKPAPAMVFFDGFDVTKELQYGYAIPDLAARGIGCLIVDGPGNGESVRFRDLPLIAETERYATPAYEYLAARAEFDPKRVGVMALSLGGYYAPRAASLEPRFACCVAWGAQWDYYAVWAKRLEQLASGAVLSLSVPPEHLQWVLGVDSNAAALKVLEGFRLDGIVQQMRCPFLLVHGEGDEQIPLSTAQTCFDAVGSKQKAFKVFTREEGGFHHCQVDDITIGVHYMWDWIADVLKPGA